MQLGKLTVCQPTQELSCKTLPISTQSRQTVSPVMQNPQALPNVRFFPAFDGKRAHRSAGLTAPRGGVWRAAQVKRVLAQLGAASPPRIADIRRNAHRFALLTQVV
jgi:hypothetical protein